MFRATSGTPPDRSLRKTSRGGEVLDLASPVGLLIAAGDTLVAETGLTSARWQVVGAIALQQGRAPVAHIANAMGLTRQSVQRIADELEKQASSNSVTILTTSARSW